MLWLLTGQVGPVLFPLDVCEVDPLVLVQCQAQLAFTGAQVQSQFTALTPPWAAEAAGGFNT